MTTPRQPFLVAAAQATPVFLDRERTVDKACEWIARAGREGAKLVLFPEGFVPTYPLWVWFIPPGRTADLRALHAELVEQAVDIGDRRDAPTRRLGEAA